MVSNRSKKLKIICSLVILFAIALMPLGGASYSSAHADELLRVRAAPTGPHEEYVPGQLIVKFKARVADAARDEFNESVGTEVIYTSRYAGFKVLKIPEGRTVPEMVELYSKQSVVEYAEPNYIRHAMWSPNDPFYSDQWHFDQINLEAAWDLDTTAPNYGGDPSIVVAVLDTGVAYENYSIYQKAPDLANTNFVPGWDFVNDDAHPNDDDGHGTHVCGTIAQSTNNGLGVAGIAFNTAIMPVRVIPGGIAQEVDGIYYATDNGARIINMSISGPSASIIEENALAYAYNHGVTIICAAGNEYEDGNPPQYPAAYDDYCIAVGAIRYDQTHAYYSNTGSYIDIVAPGGDVRVDQNGDGNEDGVFQQTFAAGDPTDFDYRYFEGTSMACPHVAGVAALILAKNPGFTPDQVRQALESSATDLGTPGKDDEYGWGLLNAPVAISWIPVNSPPNTPSSPSPANHATGVSINADLSWMGGDPDAGDTVTYDVYFGTSSSPPFKATIGPYSATQSSITYDPGTLVDGTTYYWKIVASDNYGVTREGPLWDFTTQAPGNNPPNVPGNLSPPSHATGVSINADLNWTGGDPDAGDTVTYDVYFGTSSSPPFKATIGPYSATQSSITYDPGTLVSGTKYYWKVVARDNHVASTTGPLWDFTTIKIGGPDITVSHASFDMTLPPNTIQNYALTIGNDGGATLTYGITDKDTTGGVGAAGGENLSWMKPAGMALEVPLESSPVELESAGEAQSGWQNIMSEDFEGDIPWGVGGLGPIWCY